MDATIVIPTKNGGELFDKVLTAIDHQKTTYTYEVVCVDSGSTDNTVEIIKKHHCILKQIPKEEFGHGKTRNLGASLGTGEFIVFITQDALPATDTWLQNFLDAMHIDEEVVGGFGIHYPYPECNIFDKRSLENHFKQFGDDNTIFQIDRERYEHDVPYQQFLIFFSDNNSCLRRSVWEKYPYDDVDFSEDQVWAKKMIEMGKKKLYCPFAPVYHSHDYPLKTYEQRYYDEYKGHYRVQHYIMIHNWREMIPRYIKYVLGDIKYVHSLKDMPGKEKRHWIHYAIVRDWYLFHSSYLAGKYHTWSKEKQEKMDKKMSQQFRERKQ